MSVQKIIGLFVLLYGLAFGVTLIVKALRNKDSFRSEKGALPLLFGYDVFVYFAATLGISDFLLHTLLIQKQKLVETKKLPGTLVAAGMTPGAVIAFSLLQTDEPIALRTMVPCAIAMVVSSYIGAKLVGKLDGGKIKKVLIPALCVSLVALIIRMVLARGMTGTATSLSGVRLFLCILFCCYWGMTSMFGVPGKPAATAVFLLLGLSPLAVLQLLTMIAALGAVGGSIPILQYGQYHQKLVVSSSLFGSLGAVLGALFALSINATLLNVLLLIVLVVAILSLSGNRK